MAKPKERTIVIRPKTAKEKHAEREYALQSAMEAYQNEISKNLPPPAKLEDGVDETTVKKFLRLSRQDVEMLNLIASGRPPRNATAILAAIKLKMEATVAPPERKGDEGKQPVNVTVKVISRKGAIHVGAQAGAEASGEVRDVQVLREGSGAVPAEVAHGDDPSEPQVANGDVDPGAVASVGPAVLVRGVRTKH